MNQQTLDIIKTISEKYRLDPMFVQAIVLTESSGITYQTRYEPAYKYLFNVRTFSEKLNITLDTETICQMTSWGLMQIMGGKARELGFSGYITELCTPEVGVEWGCKLLRKLFDKYADEMKVAASYNAGSPIYTLGGQFVNELYVDKVFSHLRDLRKLA